MVNPKYIQTVRKYLLNNTYIEGKNKFKISGFILQGCPPHKNISQMNVGKRLSYNMNLQKQSYSSPTPMNSSREIIQIYEQEEYNHKTQTYYNI